MLRMPFDMARGGAKTVGSPTASTPLTIFVHGYLGAAGILDPMASWLREQGIAPVQLHFAYGPSGAVDALARELDARVEALGSRGPIRIVGHSLGGLVARYWAQVLRRPVERLVCIATPHRGTERARRYGRLPLARELVPGSPLLQLLDRTQGHLASTRVVNLVAGSDRTVAPLQSAVLEGHQSVHLPGVGHNSVLYARETWREVAFALGATPEHARRW